MKEKTKISIPKTTYEILIKDCENFGFYKTDGELNKNLFLNTLIINYYEVFSADEEKLHDELQKAIKDITPKKKDELYEKLIKIIAKRDNQKHIDDNSIIISFKPTKHTEDIINYIESVLIKNEAISSYYRRLFNSYIHHPLNEREKIIFKKNYNLLLKSIAKDTQVYISLSNNEIIKAASIYSIASSKDELFNYVLLERDNNVSQTLRLSKIKSVALLSKKRELSQEVISCFDKQIKYGVQYPINAYEQEMILVKLTKHGQKLFKRIYLYRPIYDFVENNIYYFSCSYDQVLQYFQRFGRHAIILSPKSLAIEMRDYYHTSYETYRKYHMEKV